jgi:hypothetical protein
VSPAALWALAGVAAIALVLAWLILNTAARIISKAIGNRRAP